MKSYDYAQAGAYFVTICVQGWHWTSFGNIVDGQMCRNQNGESVSEAWNELPARYATVELDAAIVMPNHFHGILLLGEPPPVPSGETVRPPDGVSLPARSSLRRPTLDRSSLASNTNRPRQSTSLRGTPGQRVWQRSFHEHVIRHERSLEQLREYIATNPLRRERNRLHPSQPPWEGWHDPQLRSDDTTEGGKAS